MTAKIVPLHELTSDRLVPPGPAAVQDAVAALMGSDGPRAERIEAAACNLVVAANHHAIASADAILANTASDLIHADSEVHRAEAAVAATDMRTEVVTGFKAIEPQAGIKPRPVKRAPAARMTWIAMVPVQVLCLIAEAWSGSVFVQEAGLLDKTSGEGLIPFLLSLALMAILIAATGAKISVMKARPDSASRAAYLTKLEKEAGWLWLAWTIVIAVALATAIAAFPVATRRDTPALVQTIVAGLGDLGLILQAGLLVVMFAVIYLQIRGLSALIAVWHLAERREYDAQFVIHSRASEALVGRQQALDLALARRDGILTRRVQAQAILNHRDALTALVAHQIGGALALDDAADAVARHQRRLAAAVSKPALTLVP